MELALPCHIFSKAPNEFALNQPRLCVSRLKIMTQVKTKLIKTQVDQDSSQDQVDQDSSPHVKPNQVDQAHILFTLVMGMFQNLMLKLNKVLVNKLLSHTNIFYA